jgi:hypothetical protein
MRVPAVLVLSAIHFLKRRHIGSIPAILDDIAPLDTRNLNLMVYRRASARGATNADPAAPKKNLMKAIHFRL